MSLNDMQCRTAKPRIKPYKIFDMDGLYLQVMPTGAKYWRLKYYLHEKEKTMALGVYPLYGIKPVVMLACLRKIDKTAPEMSRRMKRICSHIFKYAIATGRAEGDPTYGLECALRKYKRGHYAALTVDEFPEFLVKLHDYKTQVYRQTYLALRLLMLTFVRTQELVEAKWSEFDLDMQENTSRANIMQF